MHFNRSLWSHTYFRRLWLARTISGFGSEITYLALPLLAATTMEATPAQMGVLTAASTLPNLVFGLWAGVWVDRVRRRPLMIMADLVRALLIGMVGVAALAGIVRLEHLMIASFLGSTFGLVAGIADNALLPALLRHDDLTEGNAKLALSNALTEGIGPGIASVIVQVLAAPAAVLLDAVSFVASAWLLRRVAVDEPLAEPEHTSIRRDLSVGFQFLWRVPVLRAMLAIGAVMQLTGGASDALRLLFITRTLGLPVTVIGAFFGVGAISALVSSAVAPHITRRLGIGPAVSLGALAIKFGWLGWLGVYLVDGSPMLIVTLILMAGLVSSFENTLFNISANTLRQSVTPQHMLGRVGATEVVIAGGALPIGAVIGGWLTTWIGIRPTLIIAGTVDVPVIVAVIVATLWRIKRLPTTNA